MKSSACDRESVALLASSALSPAEAERARDHVEHCPACREYLREMSALCDLHTAACGQLTSVEVRPILYRRIVARIRPIPAGRRGLGSPMGGVGRWQLSVVGLMVVLTLLVFGLRFLRPPSLPPTVAVRPLPRPLPDVLPAAEGSKLISYRLAINRSAEEFDRLLAHDAALPSRSSVTAFRSARALPDLGSD